MFVRGPYRPSVLSALVCSFAACVAQAGVIDDFTATLSVVRDKFHERYALEPWKQKAFNWTIDRQAELALKEAQSDPNLTEDSARRIIRDYFRSARDYHAQARISGGFASLPIGLRPYGKELFVSSVNANCNCDLEVGDRIKTWDGRNPFVVLKGHATRYLNHPSTDLRDAARRMVNPYGLLLETMPTASEVELRVLKRDGRETTVSLPWGQAKSAKSKTTERPVLNPRVSPDLVGWGLAEGGEGAANVGPFDSPLVKPAAVIWENPNPVFFQAWIASSTKGGAVSKNVGVVRIPTFSVGSAANYAAAVAEFEAIITHMNANAEALVVDIAANRGGLADYGYALASYFVSREITTPKYSYRLYPALVEGLDQEIAELDAIQTDAEAMAYFGGNHYGGFPVDVTFARDVRDFYSGMLTDFRAGKKYGQPRHYNSARIKPNPRVVYTKPLILHVDDYTASAGDMFAAILQDSKRAKIVGTWTAGAGAFTGSANALSTPLKITAAVIPIALAYRLDGKTPLENLGVLPNQWMAPNRAEHLNGFEGYTARVLKYAAQPSL